MNVYKFILPGKLVSEYIGPFGKSWLRMRSTWQTNWVCAQVHERNFGTTSECNYSYLYRSGSQNCLAIITIVLKSFWPLNSKKTFILKWQYLILLWSMDENVNFQYLYLTIWDAPSYTLVSNTLLPMKGCLEIRSWETTFSSTFSADLASSSLRFLSHQVGFYQWNLFWCFLKNIFRVQELF